MVWPGLYQEPHYRSWNSFHQMEATQACIHQLLGKWLGLNSKDFSGVLTQAEQPFKSTQNLYFDQGKVHIWTNTYSYSYHRSNRRNEVRFRDQPKKFKKLNLVEFLHQSIASLHNLHHHMHHLALHPAKSHSQLVHRRPKTSRNLCKLFVNQSRSSTTCRHLWFHPFQKLMTLYNYDTTRTIVEVETCKAKVPWIACDSTLLWTPIKFPCFFFPLESVT